MDFPVESYSFLPASRAILDLPYRSRLRNSNYTMSQQSRPTISMHSSLSHAPAIFDELQSSELYIWKANFIGGPEIRGF